MVTASSAGMNLPIQRVCAYKVRGIDIDGIAFTGFSDGKNLTPAHHIKNGVVTRLHDGMDNTFV